MQVVCLTESLMSGGAERQLCNVAAEMKRQGVDVCVMTYRPDDFYRPLLERAGVEHRLLPTGGRMGRMWAVRKALRAGKQDAVLAFLQGPCRFSELAALPWRRWGLVVSERLAVPGSHRRALLNWKQLHLLADYVTANSHVNRLMIEQAVPRLVGRTVTIYNAVDLDHFRPNTLPENPGAIRLVVAASYQAKKNMLGLIEAVGLLRRPPRQVSLLVDWFGAVPRSDEAYRRSLKRIEELGLQDCFRLNAATQQIADEYHRADAVVLPSFFEGLPNTVCEGMACGRPILMSAVCDAGNLVREQENGFLFDPASPESMAEAIRRFAQLSQAERRAMGQRSREMAETMFDVRRIATKYIELLEAASRRERRMMEHWVPEVPATVASLLKEPT